MEALLVTTRERDVHRRRDASLGKQALAVLSALSPRVLKVQQRGFPVHLSCPLHVPHTVRCKTAGSSCAGRCQTDGRISGKRSVRPLLPPGRRRTLRQYGLGLEDAPGPCGMILMGIPTLSPCAFLNKSYEEPHLSDTTISRSCWVGRGRNAKSAANLHACGARRKGAIPEN